MTPLLENILQQPQALTTVTRYQLTAGRDALQRAANSLRRKKRVVISGMGASYFAGTRFAYALASSGICVQSLEAAELLYFLDSQVDTHTALMLISRSGESVEITRLLQKIQGRGAIVVGVTNVADSTLAREATQSIVASSPPDESVAIQTYTATVATLALLHAALSGDLSQAGEELDQTADALSSWVPECVANRQSWDRFLSNDSACYLLGRGPTLATVAEGALLLHETAKCAAVGMSIPQFRHGPIEAVDTQFHAIVLGTQAETADLDAALANDLNAMHGNVRWLGPPVAGSTVTPLCPWPTKVPPRFRSIAETIPLQCVAYRKAELRKIPPGVFRWAPLVTTRESGFPSLRATQH